MAGSSPLDEQILAFLAKPGNAGLSLVQIARTLTMTARTLQRHLNENNINFSTLRDEARMRQGCHLLSESGMPISEVAKELGYVEVASFSNAFRRWTGQSPSQFRSRRDRLAERRSTASAAGAATNPTSSSQLSVP
jgi:AraC-like DNA-binding protein